MFGNPASMQKYDSGGNKKDKFNNAERVSTSNIHAFRPETSMDTRLLT